jgi:hypothetical protein
MAVPAYAARIRQTATFPRVFQWPGKPFAVPRNHDLARG